MLTQALKAWKHSVHATNAALPNNPFIEFPSPRGYEDLESILLTIQAEAELCRGLIAESKGEFDFARQLYSCCVERCKRNNQPSTALELAASRRKILREIRSSGTKAEIEYLIDIGLNSMDDVRFEFAYAAVRNGSAVLAHELLNTFSGTRKSEVRKLTKVNQIQLLQEWREQVNLMNAQLSSKDFSKIDAVLEAVPVLRALNEPLKLMKTVDLDLITNYFTVKALENTLLNLEPIEALREVKRRRILPSGILLRRLVTLSVETAPLLHIDRDLARYASSIVVSGVYDSALFVQSLGETLWDDAYLWSVDGALGAEVSVGALDNLVNGDAGGEVFSIADIQREILNTYVSALTSNAEDLVGRQLRSDFEAERDALSIVYRVMPNGQHHYAPEVSTILNVGGEAIINSLIEEYESSRELSLLAVVSKYKGSGKAPPILQRLEEARTWMTNQLAIAKGQRPPGSAADYIAFAAYENEFPELVDRFSSEILACINEWRSRRIEQSADLDRLRYIAKLMRRHRRITKAISGLIASYAISGANNSSLSNQQSMAYMYEAYKVSSSDHHIIENLATITSMVAASIITDRNAEIPDLLNRLSYVDDDALSQSICQHTRDCYDFCKRLLIGIDEPTRTTIAFSIRQLNSGYFSIEPPYLRIQRLDPNYVPTPATLPSFLSQEGVRLVHRFALIERLHNRSLQ